MTSFDTAPPNTHAGGNDDALRGQGTIPVDPVRVNVNPDITIEAMDMAEYRRTVPRWKRFYKHSLTQMLLLSVQAFCGPAMSDAIAGLGGGGLATPQTSNIATAINYAMLALVCLIGGPLVNKLGVKWALVIGAMSFPIRGSSYYCNSAFGNQWYLILGGFITGIGTGCWYVAESGAIMSLAPTGARGKYLALWIVSRNLGQLVGGAINLFLCIKACPRTMRKGLVGGLPLTPTSPSSSSSASRALPNPTFLITRPTPRNRRVLTSSPVSRSPSCFPPGKGGPVRRDAHPRLGEAADPRGVQADPVHHVVPPHPALGALGAVVLLLQRHLVDLPRHLLHDPGQVAFFAHLALFLHHTDNDLRGSVGCFGLGFILDLKGVSQRRRAQIGLWTVVILNAGVYIWSIIMQVRFNRHAPGHIDWDEPLYPTAFLPYFLVQTTGPLSQSYMYWLLSSFATDAQANVRNGAAFRCLEAIGQAISYGMNTQIQTSPLIGFIVSFALMGACLGPMIVLVNSTPDRIPADVAVEEQEIAHAEKVGDFKGAKGQE
ncbi:hypothetical protein PG996_016125, partial [Apiospora saccharicola]